MRLEEIRERWQKPRRDARQTELRWDAMAPGFYGQDVPSFEDNALLGLIRREDMLGTGCRALEIGCGAGKYCLALAGRGARVTGLDISDKMLDYARSEAARLGLSGLKFVRSDWREENLAKKGWQGAFDLVVAWITPAVIDYDSFAKFCSASRGWCVLGNHVRRAESLSDRFRALFGFAPAATAEDDIIFATAALLRQGKNPCLDYAEDSWERTSSYAELYAKYRRRLEACGPVSPESEARLRAFLEAETGPDGLLHEHLSATIGILYWRV